MGPPVTESVETGLLAALFRRRSVRAVSLVLAVLAAFLLLFAGHLWQRFGADRATEYADIEEHFKYGSTGGSTSPGSPTGSSRHCLRCVPSTFPATATRRWD